jgi:hypothetical protein
MDDDWATEMYLMFYYVTSTSQTLTPSGTVRKVFQHDIPQMSEHHPCLLSGLVAVAALHIYSENPSHEMKYWRIYRKHQGRMLCNLQKQLHDITTENCQAVFACASFLAFFVVKDFSLHSSTSFDNDSVTAKLAQTLTMVRGVKDAISKASQTVFSGPLGSWFWSSSFCVVPVSFELSDPAKFSLQRLETVILDQYDEDSLELKALQDALRILREMYREVSYARLHSKLEVNQILKFNALIRWEFIKLVENGNSLAIILFAYYAILSAGINNTWCLDKTFGQVALSYSRLIVDTNLQYLLDWAEEQCNNDLMDLGKIPCKEVSANQA